MPTTSDLAERLAGIVSLQQDVLANSTDPERVMKLVIDRTAMVTSGDGAVVERIEGDELVYAAASGSAKPHVGLRLRLEGSLSGLAIKERTVVRCDDAELDPRVDAKACHLLGIRSMIVAPLLEGGTTPTGVLKTYSSRARRFNDLDSYALQLLAGMTAAALMVARQHERYRLLFEQNVAGVFRTTLDGRILDCNRAFVETLGYASREEVLAQRSWDLYSQRSDREEVLLRLQSDRVMRNIRLQLKRKDGSSVAGIVNVSLIPAEEGPSQLLGTLVEA